MVGRTGAKLFTLIVLVNRPNESTTPPNVDGWIATAEQLDTSIVHKTQTALITFIIHTLSFVIFLARLNFS